MITEIKNIFHQYSEKIKSGCLFVYEKFGELCGWLGLIMIHAATLPTTYAVIKGESANLPPLSMVLMVWGGLLLFFIRSTIVRDRLYLFSNGIGFFFQSVLLAMIVLK